VPNYFKANSTDGYRPEDRLVQDSQGNLYGTPLSGGYNKDGTVYAINPDETGYRQLLQFNGFGSEGQMPSGSMAGDGMARFMARLILVVMQDLELCINTALEPRRPINPDNHPDI
jgi:hypothetical protein